jgi:hypothetical protein
MMSIWSRLAYAVLATLVAWAVPPGAALAQPPISHCSTTGQNLAVSDLLESDYLWYQFLPRVDPARYSSPAVYLDAVRYRALDRGFSYITSRAENDAFYDDSQFVGFGFSARTDATELRLLQVFEGSPAHDAGLTRGSHIVEIDGRSVAARVADHSVDAALEPSAIDIVFDTGDGIQRRGRLTKRVVTIPTVSSVSTFDVNGRRVGYLNFRNFVGPSYGALDTAFRTFRDAGVNELVLDLRYNGGGLVDVSVHLGSLIGGSLTTGQVFAEMHHNARNTERNRTLRFRSAENALGLSRLFVITTRASASASELLINGLRPFIPVVVIGDTTYGKPVGQYGVPICDRVAAPVAFASVNALGAGDFFDGIAADCAAADDIDRQLGDPAEASLSAALAFIRSGSCGRSTAASSQSVASSSGLSPSATPRMVGWRSVVNAY